MLHETTKQVTVERTRVDAVECDGWRLEWHVCPDCFRRVIAPALTAAGAKPTESEVD